MLAGRDYLSTFVSERSPSRVVFVDDEPLILTAIKRQLRDAPYEVNIFESPQQALVDLETNPAQVVVSDQRMPEMTGAQFLAEVRQRWPQTVRILLSGQADIDDLVDAINAAGICRFLAKPWNNALLREAVDSAVLEAEASSEMGRLTTIITSQNSRLRSLNHRLESIARERTEQVAYQETELSHTLIGTIRVLLKAIEAKDPYTAGHSELVSRFAVEFAKTVGETENLEALRFGTLLHDVGKIGIPEVILNKPSRLDKDEFAVVRTHPEVGMRIVQAMEFPWDIFPVVRHHHERWDGNGYPDGLKGTEIPLSARIVALCDVYEALTAERAYRRPMPREKIIDLFTSNTESQFDPGMTPFFVKLVEDNFFDEIRTRYGLSVQQRMDVFTRRTRQFEEKMRKD